MYKFIFLISLLPISLYSQHRDSTYYNYKKDFPVNFILKTNPFTPIWGQIPYTSEFRIAYEKITSKKQSLQLAISYLGKSTMLSNLERTDSSFIKSNIKLIVRGVRFQLSYKFYLLKNAPQGLYVAPHFSYATAKFIDSKYKNTDRFVQANYMNYNILVGYQFVINSSLSIDPFFGVGYKENSWLEHYNQQYKTMDDEDQYIIPEPLKIYLGFNIGMAFK